VNLRLILISLTVLLGMSMAIIDSSIVNVALNSISGNLGGSIDEASWVITGYLLASVVTMPLNGWLTARFGRKRYYAACIAVATTGRQLYAAVQQTAAVIAYNYIFQVCAIVFAISALATAIIPPMRATATASA